MSLDLATLKVGDRVTSVGAGPATVRGVNEDEVWVKTDAGYGMITGGAYWDLIPPPPLIDPEQVWYWEGVDPLAPIRPCIDPADAHNHHTHNHFRITATEPVT